MLWVMLLLQRHVDAVAAVVVTATAAAAANETRRALETLALGRPHLGLKLFALKVCGVEGRAGMARFSPVVPDDVTKRMPCVHVSRWIADEEERNKLTF